MAPVIGKHRDITIASKPGKIDLPRSYAYNPFTKDECPIERIDLFKRRQKCAWHVAEAQLAQKSPTLSHSLIILQLRLKI